MNASPLGGIIKEAYVFTVKYKQKEEENASCSSMYVLFIIFIVFVLCRRVDGYSGWIEETFDQGLRTEVKF